MKSDPTDAFARTLANLQPAKTQLDPARVFYEVGFAAGAAATRPPAVPLRMAASLLVAIALAGSGGFHAGHERGERSGYLAAVLAPPESTPAPGIDSEPAVDPQRAGTARAPHLEPEAGERSPNSSPPPGAADEPTRPSHSQRLSAVDTPAWQWILRQLDPHRTLVIDNTFAPNSPMRMRNTPEQWESLVNLRAASRPVPPMNDQRDTPRNSSQNSPEAPLTLSPSEEWLRAITTY